MREVANQRTWRTVPQKQAVQNHGTMEAAVMGGLILVIGALHIFVWIRPLQRDRHLQQTEATDPHGGSIHLRCLKTDEDT